MTSRDSRYDYAFNGREIEKEGDGEPLGDVIPVKSRAQLPTWTASRTLSESSPQVLPESSVRSMHYASEIDTETLRVY